METKRGLRLSEMSPGTKVQLTGVFLRSTGQVAGGEGASKWTLVPCSCALCRDGSLSNGYFVAVDEPREVEPGEVGPKWRHFNAANLQVVGGRPRASNYP